MKTILLSITLTILGQTVAMAQGSVKMYNINSQYLISTNNGAGAIGPMTTTPDSFYFALLDDATTPTSSNPLTGGWSVVQSGGVNVVGNNYIIPGSMEGTGGAQGFYADNWAPGQTNYVELVGWSANLGTTWSQIAAQLQNGWQAPGYYGISGMGLISSGGVGDPASPAVSIFGHDSISGSNGISSGFDLTPVPEPSIFALGGFGGLLLMACRRKKT